MGIFNYKEERKVNMESKGNNRDEKYQGCLIKYGENWKNMVVYFKNIKSIFNNIFINIYMYIIYFFELLVRKLKLLLK